jgi:hypothetical protein
VGIYGEQKNARRTIEQEISTQQKVNHLGPIGNEKKAIVGLPDPHIGDDRA